MPRKFRFREKWDLFVRQSPTKTLNAWKPFNECVQINFTLQNSDLGEEFPEGTMYWVYAVVNLRMVGHVLAKVDMQESDRHSLIIGDKWRQWKSDRDNNWIFWEFIEAERNNILKTYEFGVDVDLFYDAFDCHGIDLVREATYWWRRELESIENALN